MTAGIASAFAGVAIGGRAPIGMGFRWRGGPVAAEGLVRGVLVPLVPVRLIIGPGRISAGAPGARFAGIIRNARLTGISRRRGIGRIRGVTGIAPASRR